MDAFGGLGQFKKDPSKLTLAERQKQQQASKAQAAQQWSGLDSLGGLGSSLPSAKPAQPPAQPQRPAQQASSGDLLDDFFNPGPKVPAQASTQPSRQPSRAPLATSAAPSGGSLLDDFDVFTSAPPVASANSSANASTSSFGSSSRPSAPASRASPQAPARPPPRANTTQDHEIAQLVDMGFSDEDAARALDEMGSVKGAINFLMCEAQGRPVPKPKKQEDVYAMASDVGQQVFATASSWFSKGKKQLQKQLDQWDDSGRGAQDGQPAWMRSQEKHIRREQEPARSSRESSGRFEEELPRRPRPQPRAQEPSPAPASTPAPKSRAELFRERQSQRGSGEYASASASVSANASESTSARASPAPSAPKAASPAPSAPPASVDLLNMSAPSAPAISSTAQDMVATSRSSGNDAFKRGDYAGATTYFGSSLASIPRGHLLRTLLLSNRAAAFLKVGDAHAALADCNEAHEIMGPVKRDDKREVEAGKPLSDVWLKIVTRQAQAYEHLEKYPEALAQWKLLLDNGYSQPTFLEGKRRCIKAIEVKARPQASQAQPQAKSQRRGWGTTGAGPTSKEGKAAVEKVRNLNDKQARSERERGDLLVSVQAKVESWKQGKDKDLRALLSTLQQVLASWAPVTSADLVAPKKCRIVYMKAVARTHPDKVPAGASTEEKMVAESVFIVLNGAWEVFRVQNGL